MTARATVRRVIDAARHRANLRLVDSCGSGTLLAGDVRRNSPGGHIDIGADGYLRGRLITQLPGAKLQIGRNCFINGACVIETWESITIGDDFLMGPGASVVDGRSHSTSWAERAGDLSLWRRTGSANLDSVQTRPVVIEDGVWVGAHAIVLPGVTLGEGSTIGAAAVVTKSVPPFTIWAGNPARQVGQVEPVRPSR